MKRFKIRSIRRTLSWINGVEAHVDEPMADSAGPPLVSLHASGWIASAFDPISEIFLACRGRNIVTAKLVPRPDVEKAFSGRRVAGFEMSAVPAGLGDGEPLRIAMKGESGRITTLFEIDLDYAAEITAAEPEIVIAPMLALPRSGTTHLAELLHTSPAVLAGDDYPYELRLASSLANEWFDGLQPWWHVRNEERNATSVDPNYSAVSRILRAANTSSDAADAFEAHFEATRRGCCERIARLYRLVAPNPSARLVVEKIPLGIDLDLIAALAAPVKPIFIVRDPRDIMVSMRNFNARRGVYEFHEVRSLTYSEVLHHMVVDLYRLVEQYDRTRGDKLLVRYEDLVAYPARTLDAVFAFLGISGERTDAASRIPSAHVTATNAAASVGRWRNELTPVEADRAKWHLRAFLDRFGY